MIKENHYLAEKVISNIKNYKVIDEIIFSSSNNPSISTGNDVKKNENIPILITNNNSEIINQNEIIENSIKTQEIKMPNELEKDNFEKKSNNQFEIEFNDMEENIIRPIDNDSNTFNNLSINKEGTNMSNINQKHFENPIENDQNIDSYDLNNNSNAISMVDILSEDNLNSIDDLNNIVNINDVYDDLGQNFQDDLINQYKELDKSVSRSPNNLKYSYLPKRKIRDILIDKYNIKNEECVNELYSMAFNNKWKEIDIEHWLLNPTNINNLISKCCENDYIAPEIKKENNEFINFPKKLNDEVKYNSFNNKNEIKEEIKEKEEPNNIKNHTIISQSPPAIPQNNVIEAKPIFHNQPYNPSIKDDLKSVLIEENYRKMQFDFQTEILKNHIDSKFNTLNTNEKNNNEKQSYYDKKINEEFINSKMDLFFNEKKSEILDEINNLKEKFTKNEKVIWDSLDFIRQEIKQNQTSLTNSLSDSLKTIKGDIQNSLNSYIDEIQKKQNISLNKFLENFNNNDSLKPLKESFDQKFEILSNDINQLKQNVNQKNNDLSIDFMDLRKEINDRVNTISNELISNIEDLYDEVEDINESLNNINNLKDKPVINQIINEDDFKKPVVLNEDKKNTNFEKETEELIRNLENKNQELLNKKIEPKVENKDEEIINKENEIEFEEDVESKTLPNYLNFLENDEINFDNINKFNEQEMDYGNIDDQLNVNNIDFDYLESSSNEFNDNEINEFDYDNNELSKKDRDFYKNFISDIPSDINNSSKLVSNFDSKKTITNLDVENKIEIVEEKKEEFDIKSKLSKIDEIIKNSINELNDIKEIVDDKEVRIDDSIKLFEKVK